MLEGEIRGEAQVLLVEAIRQRPFGPRIPQDAPAEAHPIEVVELGASREREAGVVVQDLVDAVAVERGEPVGEAEIAEVDGLRRTQAQAELSVHHDAVELETPADGNTRQTDGTAGEGERAVATEPTRHEGHLELAEAGAEPRHEIPLDERVHQPDGEVALRRVHDAAQIRRAFRRDPERQTVIRSRPHETRAGVAQDEAVVLPDEVVARVVLHVLVARADEAVGGEGPAGRSRR